VPCSAAWRITARSKPLICSLVADRRDRRKVMRRSRAAVVSVSRPAWPPSTQSGSGGSVAPAPYLPNANRSLTTDFAQNCLAGLFTIVSMVEICIFSPQTPVLPEKRVLIAVVWPRPHDASDWQTRSCGDTSINETGYFFPSEAKSAGKIPSRWRASSYDRTMAQIGRLAWGKIRTTTRGCSGEAVVTIVNL